MKNPASHPPGTPAARTKGTRRYREDRPEGRPEGTQAPTLSPTRGCGRRVVGTPGPEVTPAHTGAVDGGPFHVRPLVFCASWTCCCPTPGPAVYREVRTTPCFPRKATGVVQIASLGQSGAAASMGGGASPFSHQDGHVKLTTAPDHETEGRAAATLLTRAATFTVPSRTLPVTSAPFRPRSMCVPGAPARSVLSSSPLALPPAAGWACSRSPGALAS